MTPTGIIRLRLALAALLLLIILALVVSPLAKAMSGDTQTFMVVTLIGCVLLLAPLSRWEWASLRD